MSFHSALHLCAKLGSILTLTSSSQALGSCSEAPQNRPFSRLNEPHSLSLRGQDVCSGPDCLGGSLLALLRFINALMISFGQEEGRTSTEVRKGIVLHPAGGGVPPSWMGFVTEKDLPQGFQQLLVTRVC